MQSQKQGTLLAAIGLKSKVRSTEPSADMSGRDRVGLHFARAATRVQLVAEQTAQAFRDQRFCELVANADRFRDKSAWADAEYNYWRALQLYPYHSGYRIQYAHMLKERQKFADAELHYRSAWALGFPIDEIREHLSFVALRNGHPVGHLAALDLAVSAMDAPPTSCDIDLLAYVLFHKTAVGVEEAALPLMRKCSTNRDVALAMMADEQFTRANLPFFEILRK